MGVGSLVGRSLVGPEEIEATGAVVSTVNARETAAVFWAESVASTVNLWSPSASLGAVNGELHEV